MFFTEPDDVMDAAAAAFRFVSLLVLSEEKASVLED